MQGFSSRADAVRAKRASVAAVVHFMRSGCEGDGGDNSRTLIGRRLRLRTEPSHFLLRPHTLPIPRWRPQCCDVSCLRVIRKFSRGLLLQPLFSVNSLRLSRGPRQPERRTFSIPTPLKTYRACMLPIFWRKLVPGKRQRSGILLVRHLPRRTLFYVSVIAHAFTAL